MFRIVPEPVEDLEIPPIEREHCGIRRRKSRSRPNYMSELIRLELRYQHDLPIAVGLRCEKSARRCQQRDQFHASQ